MKSVQASGGGDFALKLPVSPQTSRHPLHQQLLGRPLLSCFSQSYNVELCAFFVDVLVFAVVLIVSPQTSRHPLHQQLLGRPLLSCFSQSYSVELCAFFVDLLVFAVVLICAMRVTDRRETVEVGGVASAPRQLHQQTK